MIDELLINGEVRRQYVLHWEIMTNTPVPLQVALGAQVFCMRRQCCRLPYVLQKAESVRIAKLLQKLQLSVGPLCRVTHQRLSLHQHL